MWYKVPREIGVALIRGTTADVDGNVTFEKEAMLADCLNQVSADLPLWPFNSALTTFRLTGQLRALPCPGRGSVRIGHVSCGAVSRHGTPSSQGWKGSSCSNLHGDVGQGSMRDREWGSAWFRPWPRTTPGA